MCHSDSKRLVMGNVQRRATTLIVGLLIVPLCLPPNTIALAQTRSLPSHGKIKLDSYSQLLRDVHPASQAQANYLQNRLFGVGLKKAERLERKERLDSYAERRFIKHLQDYQNIADLLSTGRPASGTKLAKFWALVSVFGDRTQVYEALSSDVPPISHDEFVPTSRFIRIVEPNGELAALPLALEGIEGLESADFQTAWRIVVRDLQAGRLSARNAAGFRNSVAAYRAHFDAASRVSPLKIGRVDGEKYITSLRALGDALYREKQRNQVQRYIDEGGYAYSGGSMLGLIMHMLQHRLAPTQGSTAQLALAEAARPINRALEQEIAYRYERIDSIAALEGHRPYAAEYRHYDPTGSAKVRATNLTY